MLAVHLYGLFITESKLLALTGLITIFIRRHNYSQKQSYISKVEDPLALKSKAQWNTYRKFRLWLIL